MNFIDFQIFYNCKKELRGWLRGGGGVFKYLIFDFFSETASWIKKKNNLTGSQYPRSSLTFVYFGPINQFSIDSISLFFFKEKTCIFKHPVCAPQLSSKRINKNSQYMKLIGGLIGRARFRTRNPEGSTVIVTTTHNRVNYVQSITILL